MKVQILEEKKNKIIFNIIGETNTLSNALKDELQQDEHVKAVGYHIEHPLIGNPRFVLETDGADPKKTVLAAVKRLQKTFEKLKEDFAKLK